MSITIRQARPTDAKAIYDMIYELAVYEKAPEEVVTTRTKSTPRYLALTVKLKR
jgi:hypothetical protein